MKTISSMLLLMSLGLPLGIRHTCAQSWIPISADSLERLFEVKRPFDILEDINLNRIDYKDCYYRTSLHPKVMIWLDFDSVQQHRTDRYVELSMHEPYGASSIREWLQSHKRYYLWDSIRQDSALYSRYRDSVIIELRERKKRLLGGPLPLAGLQCVIFSPQPRTASGVYQNKTMLG